MQRSSRILMSVCALAAAASLFGCTSAPHDTGFADVQQRVADLTGRRVQWRQDGEADAAVRDAVRRLLADPLTADAAVQITLLNNRRLQAVYEDLGVAQAAVVQAGLLRNPVFDFSAGFIVGGGQTELSFGVAQDFLSIFFIPLRQAVAESDFESAKLSVTAALMDFTAAATAAYYRAAADQQMLEMRRQVAEATAASYELAQRLHEAGNIRDLDLHNEQGLHDQARLDLAAAEAAVAHGRERLNVIMGVWGEDTQWTIDDRLGDVPDEQMDLTDLESRAISSSIDLALARQDMLTHAHRLGLTKASALVPEFELGAEAEREEGEWEVGPSVALPIPLFDQGQAQIAAAQAELHRRREQYAATAVEIRSAARAAAQRLAAARGAALFYRRQILPLRQRIVDETLLQYNAMQLGAFQLLMAKQQQIDAGARYIEALHEYWLSRAALEQILRGRVSDFDAAPMPGASPSMFNSTSAEGGH